MQRITNKDLERLIARINDALGVPQEPYQETRDARGGLIANAGTCYLAGAYGGVRIEQMCAGGGSRDLLSSGYGTKRAVYDQARAWLDGFDACERKGGDV
jgi:hypothetical protein